MIDFGASYHLTSCQDYFSSYTNRDFGQVLMGNDGSSTIIAIGTVHLETSTGCKLVLRNVGHVPEIRLNLLSAGVLDDEGFNNLLGERKWKLLTQGRMVVARAQKMRSLYVMQAKVCQEEANMVDNDSSELWHKRLAHMSLKGMEILSKKNFLPDVAGMNLKPYVYCLAGKQHRVAFTHVHLPEGGIHLILFILMCALWMLDHLVVHNIMLPLSMIILERYEILY